MIKSWCHQAPVVRTQVQPVNGSGKGGALPQNQLKTQIDFGLGDRLTPHQLQQHLRGLNTDRPTWCFHRAKAGYEFSAAR